MTVRETITQTIAAIAEDAAAGRLNPKDHERTLIKSLVVALMSDGYTLNLAADALGVPGSTIRTWQEKDRQFADDIKQSVAIQRGWLLGQLRLNLEKEGKAAGQSANILANLYFQELRHKSIDLTTSTRSPSADEIDTAISDVADLLGRGVHGK